MFGLIKQRGEWHPKMIGLKQPIRIEYSTKIDQSGAGKTKNQSSLGEWSISEDIAESVATRNSHSPIKEF